MNFRRCLFLTFAIFSLIFASCSGLAGGASADAGGAFGGQKCVSVRGTISASGAFPQEIASALNKIPASSAGMTGASAGMTGASA
ncbi:MAG: hypothetical protein J5700_00050, partial [Treponema sp.]|nr:hypothetical protein [Treponema sp.]